MDFGQRGVILTLGEVRSFIRKPYIHSYALNKDVLTMQDDLKKRIYPRNPLGIIALFVFFIEAISTVSLKFMVDGKSEFVGHVVWFIILYPSVIAILFFVTLWCKRESLYSPTDFRDDSSFVNLIQKVETLEIRQEATQLDPRADLGDYMNIVKKLIDKNDIYTAIQLGRSSLKENIYENSNEVFKYLEENVPHDHGLYSRILANLAYSLIGLKRYSEAIDKLLEVFKLRGDKTFRVWHAVALAYSYYKSGNKKEYEKWLDFAKNRKRAYSARLNENINLYPEIASDLSTT